MISGVCHFGARGTPFLETCLHFFCHEFGARGRKVANYRVLSTNLPPSHDLAHTLRGICRGEWSIWAGSLHYIEVFSSKLGREVVFFLCGTFSLPRKRPILLGFCQDLPVGAPFLKNSAFSLPRQLAVLSRGASKSG